MLNASTLISVQAIIRPDQIDLLFHRSGRVHIHSFLEKIIAWAGGVHVIYNYIIASEHMVVK